jgi:hypothetical protein
MRWSKIKQYQDKAFYISFAAGIQLLKQSESLYIFNNYSRDHCLLRATAANSPESVKQLKDVTRIKEHKYHKDISQNTVMIRRNFNI